MCVFINQQLITSNSTNNHSKQIYIRTKAGRVYHWRIARLIKRSLSASILGRHHTNTSSSSSSSATGGSKALGRRASGSGNPLPPSEFATLVGEGSSSANGWVGGWCILILMQG